MHGIDGLRNQLTGCFLPLFKTKPLTIDHCLWKVDEKGMATIPECGIGIEKNSGPLSGPDFDLSNLDQEASDGAVDDFRHLLHGAIVDTSSCMGAQDSEKKTEGNELGYGE